MAKEPDRSEKHEKSEDRTGSPATPQTQQTPQDPGLPPDAIEIGPGVISVRSGQDPSAHGGRSPGGSEATAKDEPPRSSGPGHRER